MASKLPSRNVQEYIGKITHAKLLNYWDQIRSSYWFLPTVMVIGSAILALISIGLDRLGSPTWTEVFAFVWSGDAQGARGLLSTVAGSAISVAGVTFSITIVAFSLASNQFGPRVLYNFMRDTSNQIVLGTFVSTFIYCLLVLRTVRTQSSGPFIPHLSVTIAVLFAIADIGVLIYFFHHVAESVQAPNVIQHIAEELDNQVNQIFPGRIGRERDDQSPEDAIPDDFDSQFAILRSRKSGYLQAIDNEGLISLCRKNDLMMRMMCRPGDFLIEREPIAHIYPKEKMSESLEDALREIFLIGKQRTHHQNIEYSIQQLVEVAVRSLSDAINDPFTTILCIDHLAAMLAELVEKGFPSPYRYDSEGNLRIVIDNPVTFHRLTDLSLNVIRQQADDHTIIYLHLLRTIADLIPLNDSENERDILMYHATMIRRASHAHLQERNDRAAVEEAFEAVVAAQKKSYDVRVVSI